MNSDRKMIVDIISDMIDNPDKLGLYHTTAAFNALERYIEHVRRDAVEFTWQCACLDIAEGIEIRMTDFPEIVDRVIDMFSE